MAASLNSRRLVVLCRVIKGANANSMGPAKKNTTNFLPIALTVCRWFGHFSRIKCVSDSHENRLHIDLLIKL